MYVCLFQFHSLRSLCISIFIFSLRSSCMSVSLFNITMSLLHNTSHMCFLPVGVFISISICRRGLLVGCYSCMLVFVCRPVCLHLPICLPKGQTACFHCCMIQQHILDPSLPLPHPHHQELRDPPNAITFHILSFKM